MILQQNVYEFNKDTPPLCHVQPDSILQFKTQDCFANQINTPEQTVDTLNLSHANPSVGPVYVEGAQRGDALRVEILDIRIIDRAVCCTIPGCGPLHQTAQTRTVVFPAEEGWSEFKGIRFPLEPMIGVIGCAPDEPIPTGWVGDHGGNMDCKLIKKGAVLYLPVYQPGALLHLGDIHAAMGDCELNGTGLEAPALVTVRVSLVKEACLELPVLETFDKWYVIGHGPDYPSAVTRTSGVMQKLLEKAYGWDATDAYIYLSIQGDVEICQACVPCSIDMVLRCGVPKQPGRPLV